MEKRPTVALLGLGLMGHAIAGRLLEQGFELTVWNRTPEKAADLERRGARVGSTPAAAVAGAALVALCLRDKDAVEAVLFGKDGVAAALAGKGGVIVDFSTLGIAPTKSLAGRTASLCGAEWVDAPVSGGPQGAQRGTLAIFCGGTDAALKQALPLLKALSRQSTHLGPVGAGQAAKMCNQLIASSAMIAVAEAIAAAKAFGLKADLLPAAFAGGYADSLPLQIFGPRMASQNLVPRVSEIATMRKDVKAVLEAAAGTGLQLRLLRAVDAVYDLAVEQGLGGEDLGALARLM
jgi:3-hydroxyisobutyrate dehydrogenase-like beta-hydroxyacid dehydrogenase